MINADLWDVYLNGQLLQPVYDYRHVAGYHAPAIPSWIIGGKVVSVLKLVSTGNGATPSGVDVRYVLRDADYRRAHVVGSIISPTVAADTDVNAVADGFVTPDVWEYGETTWNHRSSSTTATTIDRASWALDVDHVRGAVRQVVDRVPGLRDMCIANEAAIRLGVVDDGALPRSVRHICRTYAAERGHDVGFVLYDLQKNKQIECGVVTRDAGLVKNVLEICGLRCFDGQNMVRNEHTHKLVCICGATSVVEV